MPFFLPLILAPTALAAATLPSLFSMLLLSISVN